MRQLGLRCLALMLAVWLCAGLFSPSSVHAQTGEASASRLALPKPLTRETVRELVSRLSDAEVRQLLLAELDKAAAGREFPAPRPMLGMLAMSPMVGGMDAGSHRIRDALRVMVTASERAPEALSQAIGNLTQGRARDRLPQAFGLLAGMLLIGWGAERLFGLSIRRIRRRLDSGSAGSFAAQAGRLALRLVLDLLGLIVFGLAGLAVFFAAYQSHEPTRQLALTTLAATLLVRITALGARILLAPGAPAYRLLPFEEGAAQRLQGSVVGLAVIYAAGTLGVGLLHAWGVPAAVLALLGVTVGLTFLGLFVGAVWSNRAAIAALIRGPEPANPLRRLLADVWPILMTAYLVLLFLARFVEQFSGESLGSSAAMGSLLLLTLLPMLDMGLCRVLAAIDEPRMDETVGSAPAGSPYAHVLGRGIHIAVTIVGLLLIARLWGLDLFDITARRMGTRPSEALVSILVTLLVAYLAWELARTAIDRRLARTGGPAAADAPSRLRTILPLVRGFFFVTICAMAVMIVLASLGVNIGPLLAGAGVVGIAVGFGAQTLVRDIVSGLFFLMDDSFRQGEYIDIGEAKGRVEKIGLRSMQLRHHRGALNTVPYGAIRRLVNQSRDWTIVKLEFRLSYGTDTSTLKKIFKQIGEELQEDPELGPAILEPLKSQGVIATEEGGLVVQAKFMARPNDLQYVIRREAYDRILKAFAANGIRFAERRVSVSAPQAAGPGPDLRAVGAAVAGGDGVGSA